MCSILLNCYLWIKRFCMNVRPPKDEDLRIANSSDIARIMRRVLLRQNRLHRQKEYLWVVGLSENNDLQYIELLVIGHLNKVFIDPVEVFNFAVAKKCKKIVLVHNHPSGEMKPSDADYKVTKLIMDGARTLKIKLIDHIIITESKEFHCILESGDYKNYISSFGE